ncbi:hypothetical protein SRHO_G00248050 [Serrasalmus rhombeus]
MIGDETNLDQDIYQDYNTSFPAVNQTNATLEEEECGVSTELFLHICLLPSMCIVMLISFLERRSKVYSFEERFPYLRGRFGIVVPLDFTGTLRNRWSYTFAFIAAAPQMIQLILGFIVPFNVPKWLIALMYLVAAFEVALANLPFFVCLSTTHRAVGGALGLLYTLVWLYVEVWNVQCAHKFCDKNTFDGSLMCYEDLLQWPYLLCLGFLLCRFGFMLATEVKNCLQKRNKQAEEDAVLQSCQYKYVQTLLRRPPERSLEKSWFRRKVYDSDPYFKFPSRMIATAVISLVGLYIIISSELVSSSLGIKKLYTLVETPSFWTEYLDYAAYAWYVSAVLATLSSVAHVGHVLICYRKHMKKLRAGDKSFLPARFRTPNSAVSMVALVRYPGCQIAYTLWGYLIVHFALFVFGIVFVFLVVIPIREEGFLSWLIDLITFLANFFIVLLLLKLQVLLVRLFFLQDKLSPEDKQKPLALNNRKAFHNFNYFFFFYNVILGLWSCILRLLRSAFVSLLLVSRINRTVMPKGFELLDKGYRTWIGMIMADHYHNNLVLVCFCHLLLKRTLERHTAAKSYSCVNQTPGNLAASPLEVRVRTRWLLLYTLLRNPQIILLRKREKLNDNREQLAVVWATMQTQQAEAAAAVQSTDPSLLV